MDKRLAERLVRQARRGDRDALEQLILGHEDFVYHIAYRFLGNEADALDAAQEVFLRVFQNLGRFDGKAAFSTWLYRIATNTSIDQLRKRKNTVVSLEEAWEDGEAPFRQLADPSPGPEASVLNQEDNWELMEAIRALPEDFQLILTLRDLEDQSYQEIAARLGLPMGTVKSRLARARQALREHLEREPFGIPSRQTTRKEG